MQGFLIGFMSALLLWFSCVLWVDKKVKSVEERLERVYQLCEKAGSVPYSYDEITVKCENGAEMKFVLLRD